MAQQNLKSGINGSVQVGAVGAATTFTSVTEWQVQENGKGQEFNNSGTGIYGSYETTFVNATGTVTLDWDDNQNPFTSTGLLLRFGTILTDLFLIIDKTVGTPIGWLFPLSVVTSMPQTLTVDGKIMTRVQFRNQGIYYPPGSSPSGSGGDFGSGSGGA